MMLQHDVTFSNVRTKTFSNVMTWCNIWNVMALCNLTDWLLTCELLFSAEVNLLSAGNRLYISDGSSGAWDSSCCEFSTKKQAEDADGVHPFSDILWHGHSSMTCNKSQHASLRLSWLQHSQSSLTWPLACGLVWITTWKNTIINAFSEFGLFYFNLKWHREQTFS